MHFFKTLLAGAAMISVAAAQASGILAFTTYPLPATFTVGAPFTFTYSGGGGNPVTITLKKGPSTMLQTVAILTSTATTGSYTWTPDASLVDGNDYAFAISQGDQINYLGPFTVVGGSTSATASFTPSLSSVISSKHVQTTTFSVASFIIASANASATATSDAVSNATTSAYGTAETETGTALPRNTTMSMATLTPTPSAGAGSVTGDPRGGDASAIGSSGSTGSSDPGVTMSTGGATSLTSSVAFVLGVFGAIMYLS